MKFTGHVLAVTCLTVVYQILGSSPTMGIYICQDSHCSMQHRLHTFSAVTSCLRLLPFIRWWN